jgi:hypothetical protein
MREHGRTPQYDGCDILPQMLIGQFAHMTQEDPDQFGQIVELIVYACAREFGIGQIFLDGP